MSDIQFDKMFALFKGEPGTRKSTSAASFPTPQYWFSLDQKMNAMMLPMKAFGTDLSAVDYDDYNDWNGPLKKLESFQVKCPYKTIIIDSITSLADAMNRQTIKIKTGTTTKSGAEAGNRVGGIAVNTMEDYKAEASAFQQLISVCKDIHLFHKVNVVLIGHVIGERKPDSASTHFSRIIVTGGKIISAKIPAYCDEVYHFNVEKAIQVDKPGDYGLMTTHTGDDFARTALDLPNKIIFNNDPLFSKYLKPAMDKMNSSKSVTKF